MMLSSGNHEKIGDHYEKQKIDRYLDMVYYSDGQITIRNMEYEDVQKITDAEIEQGWDASVEKYLDWTCQSNLRGLGYHWPPTTIEYVIGRKEDNLSESDCCVELPDEGWIAVKFGI